ncbi:MAG: hypothetical protein ACRDY4_04095 [Acidimicrobiia bacterium]
MTRVGALLALVVASLAGTIPSAAAGSEGGFSFRASLDDQRLDLSSSSDPVLIDPGRESTLTLELRNATDAPVVVRQVQLRGRAFDVTLVSYDVLIQARVPARRDLVVDVPIDFGDLDDQVTGLFPASLILVDPDRQSLASQEFTLDVRGKALSLMGMFTLLVAVATGLSILAIWLALLRRRLPPSRWRRALRIGVTGAGVGVVLTLLLAELRLVAPSGAVWIPVVLVPTLAAFALGYLSPGPLAIEEEHELEDWMRRATTASPV